MKNNNYKTIYVNPVERPSAQGRHKQTYNVITGQGAKPTVSMKKVKEENTVANYKFLINPRTNKLQTGLDKPIPNPFYELSPEQVMESYNLSQEWRKHIEKLVHQVNIKEQTYMEIKHNVSPGFYTDKVKYTMINLPSDFKKLDEGKTYLQDLKLILYPRPNRLTTETPRQELLIKMVENHNKIAKNKRDINPSLHDWYISEENEGEMEKAKTKEIIEEAYYHLYKLKKEASAFVRYQVGIVLRDKYSKPIIKGELSDEALKVQLSKFIETKGNDQMININAFMKVVKMLESVPGKERFNVQYLVQQARNANVIGLRDNIYVWHSQAGDAAKYDLGSSFEKMVSFFLKEFKEYNPNSDISNAYKDLHDEVFSKGVRFEN